MPNPSLMKMNDQIKVLAFLKTIIVKKKFYLYVKPHPGINYKKIKRI